MISIVIPLYNKERQVGATLRSVLAQTYQDFEVMVVDDGSTDGSVAVVEAINDQRIRIIRQKNGGVSAARNTGIREAKGEFISFLDADDEWKPVYLATQARLIQTYPECDVFATNYEFKDESGKVTPTILNKLPFDGQEGVLTNYFEVASCSHPPLWTSAVMARKTALESVGGFPDGIKSGEDLLTWARLACRYKIAYSRQALAVYNLSNFIDDNNKKVKHKSEIRLGGEQYVLDELLKLYADDSLICVEKHSLKSYIHRWYRIYCVLLIEGRQNHKVLKIGSEAIKFGAPKSIMSQLILLGLLPTNFARWLFLKVRR